LSIIRRDILITGDLHQYELLVSVKNETKKRIDDWYVEVSIPVPLVFPMPTKSTDAAFVETRGGFHIYRAGFPDMGRGPILSGERAELRLPYRMDEETHQEFRWKREAEMNSWAATARVFLGGEFASESELRGIGLPPNTLQNF
jgi:hypothetical protein